MSVTLACLCVLGGGMVVSSVPALAVRNHVFAFAFGSAGSGNGQFTSPNAIAVNESTGDVYVLDEGEGNRRVQYFSSTGAYLGQFNGSGLLPGEGKAAGSGGRPGEVETGRFERPSAIAVDNSTNPFDPSAGDVYVVDRHPFSSEYQVIDKFSSTGAYIGQITPLHSHTHEPELGGMAVDSNGTVRTMEQFREGYVQTSLVSFTDGVPNEPIASHLVQRFGSVQNLAVDQKEDLYATGDLTIKEYGSNGETLNREFGLEKESIGVAVEGSGNDVYSADGETVARYNPQGALVERFGAGRLSSGSAVGVNSSSGAVYVIDGGAREVNVFTLESPAAPTAEAWVTDVTADAATLHAEVNPHGMASEYHLEYGPCASGPVCFAPVPDGQLGAEFENRSFSVQLQGLQPGTAYHFRVVAHNSIGTVEGPRRTFTTQYTVASGALPDGRAWEMVSPPDKHGAGLEPPLVGYGKQTQASFAGEGIAYAAYGSVEGQPQGNRSPEPTQLLSRRSAAGWTTKDITTPFTGVGDYGAYGEYRMFSPDLSGAVFNSFAEAKLSSEATERTPYLRHNDTCEASPATCYVPLVTPADVEPSGLEFGKMAIEPVTATPDLSHVVFFIGLGALLPEGGNTYEWSKGKLQSVLVLPDRTVAEGGVIGSNRNGFENVRHALSDDGEHVVFEAESSGSRHLYTRDMVKGETVQIDTPEPGAAGNGSPPLFQSASSDGSRVFFTDASSLTVDSTASESLPDLYEFDVKTGKLADLTVDSNAGEHAGVQGLVQGASEDGSYVYFVASGMLAPGATPGDCGHAAPARAVCNLYVRHDGATKFIAALAGDDQQWQHETADLRYVTARVSPNGRWFAFMSARSLTGYDNRDANSGAPDEEVFLYDAGTGHLRCVSCNPTGARPVGMFQSGGGPKLGPLVDSTNIWSQRWLAALIPGWYKATLTRSAYQPRYLSDTGRLFFMSNEGLVAQDVNGTMDVYEYESEGEGNCTRASVTFGEASGGCVGLISSGGSGEESVFMDASENGSDVFFLTAAKLRPEDYDNALDMYDAHVCTSSSPCIPLPPPSPPPCSTVDACKPALSPQPTVFGAAPSATFSGAGNVIAPTPTVVKAKSKPAKCRRGFVKRKRGCVRKLRAKRAKRSAKGRK
jgi:Tol biopolymer transport system component/DNA-binding beta-propeller fold protein YncE